MIRYLDNILYIYFIYYIVCSLNYDLDIYLSVYFGNNLYIFLVIDLIYIKNRSDIHLIS
jgi:hypothetical protein